MKNFEKQHKSLHYFIWLLTCWVRNIFDKKANSRVGKFGRVVRFSVAVLVVSIPISFYLVQPNDQRFAIAEMLSLKANKMVQVGNPSFNARNNSFNARKKFKAIEQPSSSPQPVLLAKKETALDHARKHVDPTYVCPMHSEIVSKDSDANCPICGMNLVQVESGGESGVVSLSPNVINSLGVRTEVVKRKTLYRRIDSVGYVSVDENSIRTVNLRTEGWIERLAVNTVGERVKKGQLLLEVYSPKLVNAQEEYVQAKALGNDVLIKASSERLRALGVSKKQIRRLKTRKNVQQNIKIYASRDGVISELNVREGMFVKPSKALINMVDLSSVWLLAEVFERHSDWVKVGQRAYAYLPYLTDKTWEGKVEYVYPSIDLKTRSLKVRLRFDNPDEQLKPNMYANVILFAKPRRKVLSIPREALIRTGNEQRVIVDIGDGKFMPMKVRVGLETDTRVEILSGLAEGDKVVTSSQFLIDSESSMRASLARLGGE